MSRSAVIRLTPTSSPPSRLADLAAIAASFAQSFAPGSAPLEAMAVANALETLSEEHRAVLLLAVVEGFTCREVAAILSVPLGTVMSRLNRARQALREALEPARHESVPAAIPCRGGEMERRSENQMEKQAS